MGAGKWASPPGSLHGKVGKPVSPSPLGNLPKVWCSGRGPEGIADFDILIFLGPFVMELSTQFRPNQNKRQNSLLVLKPNCVCHFLPLPP